ncbi:MAG TPA: hypothetical protein PKL30_25040 [Leptospiraceae bacterium]|nr:hypothetical protein [Leptospiraceae bacterium]HMW08634.1 hypothetical protein [Leptospiraceae bacterium]HNF57890.1 hypothetical protein [Leptospiraceae bacterium]HNH02898.1 hypothetical protein [Leptospiraceae bacterium]HNH58355.1 hypothetical protein [Leptospiraceae bacterium]
MKIIDLHFLKFKDIDLQLLMSSEDVGLYTIWDSRAKVKPSYIGQGNIIQRFAVHKKKYSFPIDGYIALYEKSKTTKKDMEIAEAILLGFSELVDRFPSNNISSGAENFLRESVSKNNKLRLNMHNYNPFEHPKRSSEIVSKNIIELYFDDEDLVFDSLLRKRKKSVRFLR